MKATIEIEQYDNGISIKATNDEGTEGRKTTNSSSKTSPSPSTAAT